MHSFESDVCVGSGGGGGGGGVSRWCADKAMQPQSKQRLAVYPWGLRSVSDPDSGCPVQRAMNGHPCGAWCSRAIDEIIYYADKTL